jgi:hypothetical protein
METAYQNTFLNYVKDMKTTICIILIFYLISAYSFSQTDSLKTNSVYILLNEKSVDRPINLHNGQFQLNFNYQFGVQSKKFDNNGNKMDFSEDGRASLKHFYCLDVKYGLSESLEIFANLPYARFIERGIPTAVISLPYYQLNTTTENKGFYDLSLGLSFQFPFRTKKFFMSINGGAFLPTAKYKPDKPQHEIVNNPNYYNVTTNNAVYFNYYYYNRLGDGIYKVQLGGAMKLIIKKWALFFDAGYIKGLGEADNIKWEFQLDNNAFQYREVSYKVKRSDNLQFNGGLVYQTLPWFAITTKMNSFNAFNGWNEETGRRVKNPEMNLVNFVPGFEIQVTPHLRWIQEVGFPVTGRNNYAPLFFSTGISMNYFPFKR